MFGNKAHPWQSALSFTIKKAKIKTETHSVEIISFLACCLNWTVSILFPVTLAFHLCHQELAQYLILHHRDCSVSESMSHSSFLIV